MKLPVIICSYNRPTLIKQTIESLKKNSDSDLQIIVVDSSTDKMVSDYLHTVNDIVYCYIKNQKSIGDSKLCGTKMANESKFIYFSDDDIYFLPHWDTIILEAFKKWSNLAMIGGRGVHGNKKIRSINKTHDVGTVKLQSGFSQMIRRLQWDQIKYLPDHDEDSWLSYEIRNRFGNDSLGVIMPPVIVHCGYTSTTRGNDCKTYDWQNMEESMKKYPDIYFK